MGAFLTMWQVLTCDSWASGEGMARHLIYVEKLNSATPFFVSYIFVGTIIMSNVVITILLEGYLTSSDKEKSNPQDTLKDSNSDDEEMSEIRSGETRDTEQEEAVNAEAVAPDDEMEESRFDSDIGIIIQTLLDQDVRKNMQSEQL